MRLYGTVYDIEINNFILLPLLLSSGGTMTEYQASYRGCPDRRGALRTLKDHPDVTILAEETGGWFIEATELAVRQIESNTELTIKEVKPHEGHS